MDSAKKNKRPTEPRDLALYLLGFRAMSAGELAEKLRQRDLSEESIAETIAWLIEIAYLDDLGYARDVVAHYFGRGYGPGRVRQELQKRRVPQDLWAEALDASRPDTGAVDRFIAGKLRGEIPDKAGEKRVADALARRGFGWDEIRAGLMRYLSGNAAGEDEPDPWAVDS